MRTRLLVACVLLASACGGGGSSQGDAAPRVDGPGGVDGAASADAGGPPDAGGPTDLARLEDLVAALPGAADHDARRVLVDAFFTQVLYGTRGFPIRDEGVLAVALMAEPGDPLTLAGDFDGWNAGDHALVEPVPGFGFQYVIVPGASVTARSAYKLVRRGGETYFADPRARRYAYDEFGELSLAADGDQQHLERWPDFAEGAGTLRPRTLTVLVPDGARTAGPLPVMFAHDGQNLFAPDAPYGGWRAIQAAAGAAPFILAALDATEERFDEYTHVSDLYDGARYGGRGDEYLDFVVNGLRPFITARYGTRTDRASTAIMGSSLGGLISVYAGHRHRDVFGTAISLSGSFFWGGNGGGGSTIAQLYVASPPTGLKIYLDSGSINDNYGSNVDLAATLRTLGWVDETSLFYRFADGAGHNEAAWAARLPAIFTTVFPGPR